MTIEQKSQISEVVDVYELLNLFKRFNIFHTRLNKRLKFYLDVFVRFVRLKPFRL